MEETTFFEVVGGQAFFVALVERFYEGVLADPVLRPLYPEELEESKSHLSMFLIQYFGGPSTYQEVRGHPRLRMRHAPYVIGPAARDAWIRHMLGALDTFGLEPALDATIRDYFVMAAHNLQNSESD